MTNAELIKLAEEAGFRAAMISISEIVQNPAFRQYCEENLCGKYNANYSCPPDCGTVEKMQAQLNSAKQALVLQTIWEIGSYENKQAVLNAKKAHNDAMLCFADTLYKKGVKGFSMGYGGCPLCEPCNRIQNKPCAHPDKKISCMSAYCIDVGDLAAKCGFEFAWIPEKLFLFGMFVLQ